LAAVISEETAITSSTSSGAEASASEAARDTALRGVFEALGWGQPEGVWSAPGRVNVIGEHTDYNDGFVLPMAIDRSTLAAARHRNDRTLRVHSAQVHETVEVDIDEVLASTEPGVHGWAAYPIGVAWALAGAGHDLVGADIVFDSDVPMGSGLSSSAALECACALALAGLAGFTLDRAALARLTRRAENAYVGVPTGPLDQLASAYGEAGHVLFIDTRDLLVTPYRFDLAEAGLTLLVIDTRAAHAHGDSGYRERRASCEAAAATLGVSALRDVSLEDLPAALRRLDPVTARRAKHVITENARVLDVVSLLRQGRVRETGPLLTASHVSMRDDFEISCPELDVAVDTALATGALGARLTGGGFGGSAIALVESAAVGPTEAAITKAFQDAGFALPPVFFPALPARGATRVS
jgi:galactokinase